MYSRAFRVEVYAPCPVPDVNATLRTMGLTRSHEVAPVTRQTPGCWALLLLSTEIKEIDETVRSLHGAEVNIALTIGWVLGRLGLAKTDVVEIWEEPSCAST